jgi:hypothetical protein
MMNRLASIGLSIAVAPAILLGFGELAGRPDVVEVASTALFWLCLPVGTLFLVAGTLSAARNRFLPATPAVPWSGLRARARAAGTALARLPAGLWLVAPVALVTYWAYSAVGGPPTLLAGRSEEARGLIQLLRNGLFWITFDVAVSFVVLVWIFGSRRLLPALPYSIYWVLTLAAAFLAYFDRPSPGTWGGMLQFTSALFLSFPWGWGLWWLLGVGAPKSAPYLQGSYPVLAAFWSGIVINQALLALFAAKMGKKPGPENPARPPS